MRRTYFRIKRSIFSYFSHFEKKALTQNEQMIVAIVKSQEELVKLSQQKKIDLLYHDNNEQDDVQSLALKVDLMQVFTTDISPFIFRDIFLEKSTEKNNQNYLCHYEGVFYTPYQERYTFKTLRPFAGTLHQLPNKGLMKIRGEFKTIVVDIQNSDYIDIDLFTRYHDSHLQSSWSALGF